MSGSASDEWTDVSKGYEPTEKEFVRAAEVVQAVTARLSGPRVVWVLHEDGHSGFVAHLFGTEARARKRWIEMLSGVNNTDDATLRAEACAAVRAGEIHIEFSDVYYALYSANVDDELG